MLRVLSLGILPTAFGLCLFVPGAAQADWTPVAPDNGIYAAYADRATLRRDGPFATMLGMYDFPKGDFTPKVPASTPPRSSASTTAASRACASCATPTTRNGSAWEWSSARRKAGDAGKQSSTAAWTRPTGRWPARAPEAP